jgi:hypothetical protein
VTSSDRKTLLGYSMPKVSTHPGYNAWELEVEHYNMRLGITQFKAQGLTPATWSIAIDTPGQRFESRGATERIARNRMYKQLRDMWHLLKFLLDRGP